MSFTELARIVGNRWKNIESDIKQTYEDAANVAKDEYLRELSEYQKTEEYKVCAFLFYWKMSIANL